MPCGVEIGSIGTETPMGSRIVGLGAGRAFTIRRSDLTDRDGSADVAARMSSLSQTMRLAGRVQLSRPDWRSWNCYHFGL